MAPTAHRSRTTAGPFLLTGHANPSRSRLFSTFAFVSDPLPVVQPIPRTCPVNPFTISTLPTTTLLPSTSPLTSSPPVRYFQPLLLTASSPPPPLPAHPALHCGLTTLRTRTFPTHTPSAPSSSLSLSHHRDIHWAPDPHADSLPTDALYREGGSRGGGKGGVGMRGVWRGVKKGGELFSDWRGDEVGSGEGEGKDGRVGGRQRKGKSGVGEVRHADAWRGGGASMRGEGSERGQMAGKAEVYLASPFERTEAVQSKLTAEGMRSGHRSCEHSHHHRPLRLGAQVGLSGEQKFHSRRSADGVCRHNCNGVE